MYTIGVRVPRFNGLIFGESRITVSKMYNFDNLQKITYRENELFVKLLTWWVTQFLIFLTSVSIEYLHELNCWKSSIFKTEWSNNIIRFLIFAIDLVFWCFQNSKNSLSLSGCKYPWTIEIKNWLKGFSIIMDVRTRELIREIWPKTRSVNC